MRNASLQIVGAALCGALGLLAMARGAPLHWVGPMGGNWSDAANWSLVTGGAGGDGPPTAADTAVFDGGATNNASLDAAYAGTVGGVQVADGYTGTVTQRRDLDVGGDFDLLGGVWTFVAGTPAALDVDGDLTVAAELRCPYSSLVGEGTGRVFTVGQSVIIETNGWINADGMGFPSKNGPGVGGLRDGGSHGGYGGDYAYDESVGPTYGCMTNPVSLGSGGAARAGGGAIVLDVGGTLVVEGILSADGDGTSAVNGAGAGGSLNLTAGVLTGTGLIRANGGAANEGGGAGGRISHHGVATDLFEGILEVRGANAKGLGHTGTLFLSPDRRAHLILGGTGNLQTVRLGSDGVHDYVLGAVTIQSNGVLEVDGHPLMNDGHGGAATLQIDSLDVQEAGILRADGLGFAGGQGPGKGGSRDGGSHGGYGGDRAYDGTVGPTYGCMTNPIALGSGGGGARGGGALILEATGSITVDGTLSADGGAPAQYGSGSGGSINLKCLTLSGTGAIRANGPMSTEGSGGGGRISLTGVETDSFSGSLEVNGERDRDRSHAGTIFLNTTRRSNLTLGGAGNLRTLRLGTDGSNDYHFGSITIRSNAVLEVDCHPLLNGGQGGAAELVVNRLDVQAGGWLRADVLGFHGGQGPGSPSSAKDGGSYGGLGGDHASDDTVGPCYGSLTHPAVLGSKGSSIGGGGAILVRAAEEILVNGIISADGGNATYGAGAGGTVHLVCDTLGGTNTIRALGGNAASTHGNGGGGRIAIHLLTGVDCGNVEIRAHSGIGGGARGAAGTVYVRTAADPPGTGLLRIDNNGVKAPVTTSIGDLVQDTAIGTVIITNAAVLSLETNQALTVHGDWLNYSGFSGDTNSLVTLASPADATVLGQNTFWSLSATNAGKTVTFESARTNAVRGHLALRGVVLKATEPGVQTWLALDPESGTQDIGGVAVRDNNASLGATLVAGYKPSQSDNAGNNVNWLFPGSPGTIVLIR